MKSLLRTLLLCVFALNPIFATPTVSDRGSGNHNSSAASITITPGSNSASGSMGVLVVALDNGGSAGANTIAPTSATDSVGNVWTLRINPLFDNGAASAGVEVAFYTAPLTTAFTTSNNVVLTWLSSTSITAKAWALFEVVPTAGKTISYITGAAGTGSTTGTPTVTTGSITSGDVVIGGGGAESADTWAGDADTSNGSWSTHQHNAAGTGTSGMSVTAQSKVVTGTATQTYNPTLTSVDTILGWVQLREVAVTGAALRFF